MKMDLYKIMEKKYLESFLDGELYMNTLEYFQRAENNAIGDYKEGICETVPKSNWKQNGWFFPEELRDAIKGNVFIRSDYYGLNNAFCMYQMRIDDDSKTIEPPDKQLADFGPEKMPQMVAVRINNPEAFMARVERAINDIIKDHTIEYGIVGPVSYSNQWISADRPLKQNAFNKATSFSYQKEWRICILRNALDGEPYKLKVGNVRDITEVYALETFINDPGSIYSGYDVGIVTDSEDSCRYSFYGSLDAVSHLMSSYITPPNNALQRSDEAQASWHYWQWLKLEEKHEEIESYLKERLEQFDDIEHIELLRDYYLERRQWVEAIDVYGKHIKAAKPIELGQETRFFFSPFDLLMHHGEELDAWSLLVLARDRYNLPQEEYERLVSDPLFALAFYDQVIPIYLKMLEGNHNPIIYFYLAVSYFYTLRFEDAVVWLTEFDKYFSHDPNDTERSRTLRALIACFKDGKPLETGEEKHNICIDNNMRETFATCLLSPQKEVQAGVEFLYYVDEIGAWEALNRFQIVGVSPATVYTIVDAYRRSSDEHFYNILIQLSKMSSVQIKSPSIEYYYALKQELGESCPPHIIMEQAVFAEHIAKNS